MTFWRCYYHVIWTTKHRTPIIPLSIEDCIFSAIEAKSASLDSPMLASNAVPDHIHIAVSIPPKLAPADWVRHVKGVSARDVNAAFPSLETPFRWQDGYGILTFGAKHLNTVISYIQRQKEHHADTTIIPYLEQVDD
jgi:putative transposase